MLLSLASCAGAHMDGGENFAPDSGDWIGGNYDNMYAPDDEAADDALPEQSSPEYGKLIENKWISTSDEPTSTFSSDVDTASYSRLRSYLKNGMTFESLKNYYGASIRTEELLNYFKYTTNSPENGDLFGVRTEIAPCPWNKEADLLMMTFRAKDAETVSAGNNLVFLIDTSGSMASADKLPLLKTSFNTLIDSLGENDRISIVTYSGSEKTVLAGASGAEKQRIRNAVSSLSAGGSTNGSAGMERAYSLARDYFIEGGNNRIIMATDGDLNVGITSTDGILAFVEEKRQSGIYISTLGFGGGGYNDKMLETIADNGNGAYYFIDGTSEAEKIFGEDLLSTLYTVAEDVKFQLTFNPEAIAQYRLVGYENRLMNNEDFENDAKDAGEVGASQQLVVCYEIKMTDTEESPDSLMTLAIRYKDPGATEGKQNDYTIGAECISRDASDDLRFASAVIVTSMLLHDSEYLDEGITLSYVNSTLAYIVTDDFYKNEFKELIALICS